MLERLRNTKSSAVILVGFAAIILVFVFWGANPGGGGKDDRNVVAMVDGKKIEVKEYAALYKRELDYYRQTFKDQPIKEIERKLDLKGRTIGILVNRAIAIKAAGEAGIEVSKADVQQSIQSMEAFQKNGVFDKQLYFNVLSSNRINPADFEKGVEEDMLAARLRESLVKGVTVSDDEVKDAYFKINRKVDLDFVAITPDRFKKDIKVTDDEAQQYLKENGSQFMLPAKVKAFYSYAGFKTLAAGMKITEKDIENEYHAAPKEYMTEARVRARHILIRPESRDPEKVGAATQEARKKAEEVLKELKAGGDFAALAKKYSRDPGSASQGGDLGWFEHGVMIKPFEDVVFSMKKGEISGVVETEFGFHIIKLDDKVDSVLKPLNEVKDEITEELAHEKAFVAARGVSLALTEAFRKASTEEELKKAVAEHPGVKGAMTHLFAYDDDKVSLAKNEMVKDVVFTMRQGDVSRVLETPQGIYVVKLIEKVNPRVPEYSAVASKIKSILTEKKAVDAAGAQARQFMERLKNGEAFSKVAADEKYKVQKTGYFSLIEGFIPKVGVFAGDKPELFALTKDAPVYDEVLSRDNNFYLFSLAGAKDADESGFAAMKEELSNRLLADKQEQAIGEWFEKRRAETDIQVFDDRL